MIRVAIIGLGAAARNIHLPAYSELKDEVTVVAGCDIDADARAYAKSKWHIQEVYDNPLEMIEKTGPDIISICTPPSLHREQCLISLEHGCHVFCEKPLAESMPEADEIIQGSLRARRFVVVNSEFPYMKTYMAAKRLIGSPEFGRLLFLHAWQTFRPTGITEAGWRGRMERRISFDFGIHVFELIRSLFEDDPVRIFCHMPRPYLEKDYEVANVISLEFGDGRGASIVLDRLSKGPESYLEMRLDGEFASIHTSIGGEARFEIGFHTRERQPFARFSFAKGGKAVLQNGNHSKIIAKEGINPFASATAVHFRNFIMAIQKGNEPPGTARDNRNTLALCLAACDSALSRRVVELEQYFKN